MKQRFCALLAALWLLLTCAAPAPAGSSRPSASTSASNLLFMFIPPIPLSNAAPLCLRRIAEILYPYFVALSCNTSSIAAKARRIRMQNILANRSCQMMRRCLNYPFPAQNPRILPKHILSCPYLVLRSPYIAFIIDLFDATNARRYEIQCIRF